MTSEHRYCITGIKTNGQRFKPIYTNQPENYNIYKGTLWRVDSSGKRTKVKSYYN